MYKLICFDLDDTLWPCMPTIQHAEQTIYNWLSQHKSEITQRYTNEQLREKRRLLMQSQPGLMNDLSEARRCHLRELADEINDDYSWIETAFNVFLEARQKVTLYEDVEPVLADLKQQFKLVALTNGNAHIDKTGLSEYFEFQVSAADVQAAKPHPAMFIRAMHQAGVTPGQTLHVGDHPVHDIRGARNAGVDAAWIRREEQSWQADEPKPQQQFSDLYELQRWLMRA